MEGEINPMLLITIIIRVRVQKKIDEIIEISVCLFPQKDRLCSLQK